MKLEKFHDLLLEKKPVLAYNPQQGFSDCPDLRGLDYLSVIRRPQIASVADGEYKFKTRIDPKFQDHYNMRGFYYEQILFAEMDAELKKSGIRRRFFPDFIFDEVTQQQIYEHGLNHKMPIALMEYRQREREQENIMEKMKARRVQQENWIFV